MNSQKQNNSAKIIICCSYFDLLDGPKQITTIPKQEEDKKLFTSEFFDFHDSGDFFTHIFHNQISFNKLFDIERHGHRGGGRQYMLTALVSIELLRKRDLLQYYPSINQMFDSWSQSFRETENINNCIIDGQMPNNEDQIRLIINKMQAFLEEFDYIISTMPEVVSIPMNKLN